jgi:hypothetical protein
MPTRVGYNGEGLSFNLLSIYYIYNRHYNEHINRVSVLNTELKLVNDLTLAVAVRPLAWLLFSSIILGYIVDIFNSCLFVNNTSHALIKCNIIMLLQRFNSVILST